MPSPPPDRELTFFDHLDELRRRVMRGALYCVIGAAVSFWATPYLLKLLRYPAEAGARAAGVEQLPFLILEPAGGFMLLLNISLVAGLILAGPFLLLELWWFIAPALHRHERRWVILIVPAMTALFGSGVVFCYWLSPRAFTFLFSINQGLGASVQLTLVPYLYFFLKLLLVFGASFELPVLITVLGVFGLVSSRWLLRQWRFAAVFIAVLAAVVTPTGDPVTMSLLGAPLLLLYFLSIYLVRMVEKRRPAPEPELPDVPPPSPDLIAEAEDAPEEP